MTKYLAAYGIGSTVRRRARCADCGSPHTPFWVDDGQPDPVWALCSNCDEVPVEADPHRPLDFTLREKRA